MTSPQWKTLHTASNTYGPYECENTSIKIVADEWKHRIKWVQDITLKIARNWHIISTNDFDEHNIGFTYNLGANGKCIPVVIRAEKKEVQILWQCLEKIIKSNQLMSDIMSKKGMKFEICALSEYVLETDH